MNDNLNGDSKVEKQVFWRYHGLIHSTIERILLKRFHLNGNVVGFGPQTPKLELHAK